MKRLAHGAVCCIQELPYSNWCTRALHEICYRKKWNVIQAWLAGDGLSVGSRPASGKASVKRSWPTWPNCNTVAKSTPREHSATARFEPYWRKKRRPESQGPGASSAANTTSSPMRIASRSRSSRLQQTVTTLPALMRWSMPFHISGNKWGRPLHKPQVVHGDWGYSCEPHRRHSRERRITPVCAKIGASHSTGWAKHWPLEWSIAWLHSLRGLRICYERCAHGHGASMSLACALICWTRLKPMYNQFRNNSLGALINLIMEIKSANFLNDTK